MHNTSATRELSVYLDGQRLRHECHPTYLGVTIERTVLQRTLDKDGRQAEEPKQLADEASRFHLGRQRQDSAVICSGALLFISRVLCPSLVTLCSVLTQLSQVDVQLNSTMRRISGTLRSTPLPWLLVLSNIEPPALRRKAAIDKLVEKIVKHDSWPIQPDILKPPLLRVTSRNPLWLDLQPVDIKSRWRHNWKSAEVVNSHLGCDPTIRQLGFDVPRQQWSPLERFRTDQGHCGACRRKWRLTDTELSLWRDPDDVLHCRILSSDKTAWRLISDTLRG